MIDIKNNVISITKGDSATIKLVITDISGNVFTPGTGDVIVFSAKKSVADATEVISITSTSNQIVFVPSSTSNLEVGNYIYDVQLTTATGDIYTVIAPSLLTVLPEVHNG